jgi:tetratricopeptide (TPR) repeat protein
MRLGLSKEKMLQDAIEAGQSGDLQRARSLLFKLLSKDNRDPLYWLLMSTAVESREERIYCLHNVLFLDRQNSAAIHDLELLGAEIPKSASPAIKPVDSRGWETEEIDAPKISVQPKERPVSLIALIAVLAIGAAAILLGYYAAENRLFEPLIASGEPPAQITPTATLPAEAEPELLAPSQLLSATYTATPRYVNTPHPESDLFLQGLHALDAEDWELAAHFFQQYHGINPQTPDAAYYLGLARLNSGDFAGAGEAFSQSLQSNPQFAPAYLGRAQLGIARGDNASLILTDLNTAILLDPAFVEAYLERSTYYLNAGDTEEGLEDLTIAERLAPASALVHYFKALAFFTQGEFAGALQASELAYEIDLTLLPNYIVLASAQQENGRHADSIRVMQTYLMFEREDGRGWELLGVGYELNAQHDLALEAFDRALSLDSTLPRAAYYTGLEALNRGDSAHAISNFQAAISSSPDWFDARLALARTYLTANRPSTAFFELNASSSLIKNNEQRGAFFYWRATILEVLAQHENALADWRSLLNLPAASVPPEWRETAQSRIEAAQ